MTSDEFYGYVGLAYVGVLCGSKAYSCSINEKLENIVTTAEVLFILALLIIMMFQLSFMYLGCCP